MNKKYDVQGMTCASCSANIEKSVGKVGGVASVQVSLLTNSMVVDFDSDVTTSETIVKAVRNAGYDAAPAISRNLARSSRNLAVPLDKSAATPVDVAEKELSQMKLRLTVSFIFILPLLYLAMGRMFEWPLPSFFLGAENAMNLAFTDFLLLAPIALVNNKFFRVGFRTLFRGYPNMDSLIAIGSSAAIVYGIFAIYRIGFGLGHGQTDVVEHYLMDLYFESAGTILTLITLGKYLEARSKSRTSEAITKLVSLAPKTATIIRDGAELDVAVEDVRVGDLVVVRPGQSIPVDGIIVEGSSAVDQSALTGESMPVEKGPGDSVAAATINKSGYFRFEASKVGDDTTLAQIIALVEEASSSKAPIAKLADKISAIFVPIVIAIAVLAALAWLVSGATAEFALSIGIAVLVISCPCALGLATPVAIMVGTGKGAGHGILIKSAEALETAHGINTVVLDKTGTITAGKPQVTDILVFADIAENELLSLAASLEKPSEHPLAEAILKLAGEKQLEIQETSSFAAIAGRGIRAAIKDRTYLAGSLTFMQENGLETTSQDQAGDKLAAQGKTPLYFADENRILGLIAVADIIKPTSREAIRRFKAMGIDVVMLTGDNRRTAEAIRSQLDIDRVVAEVLPADKEQEIHRLQASGRKVAMIGDGINDAPALVRADVGIAIGAGTDIAIESADIILMKSDLLDAVTAIELSKSVIRNIKQNLFWAFFYNTVGIPLAAGVFFSLLGWKLSPTFAAAAMSLSSVSVVTNALRLKLFKPHHEERSKWK